MSTAGYAQAAATWTEDAYADSAFYLSRRACVVRTLGVPLRPGDRVLDLACGDGGFAEHLLDAGLAYSGVDATPAMVAAARRRLGGTAAVMLGDLNEFRPAEPVAATCVFRAIYYARDRAELLEAIAGYTTKKLVFDLNPRQYSLAEVRADVLAAGFDELAARPFFTPQTRSLPRPARPIAAGTERVAPLARAVLRHRFTYICAAIRRPPRHGG